MMPPESTIVCLNDNAVETALCDGLISQAGTGYTVRFEQMNYNITRQQVERVDRRLPEALDALLCHVADDDVIEKGRVRSTLKYWRNPVYLQTTAGEWVCVSKVMQAKPDYAPGIARLYVMRPGVETVNDIDIVTWNNMLGIDVRHEDVERQYPNWRQKLILAQSLDDSPQAVGLAFSDETQSPPEIVTLPTFDPQ